MKKWKLNRICSALVLTVAVSCVKVSYGSQSDPQDSSLSFSFDFSRTETKPSSIPENTEVFMSELVNGFQYQFNSETGFVIEGGEELPVKNGEYYVVSIGSDADVYELTGEGVFQVQAYLNTMSGDEITSQFSPGLQSIATSFRAVSSVSAMYLSTDRSASVHFSETDRNISVPITPEEMGITFDFSVILNVEDGVVVDSVCGCISGVPTIMRLSDGAVSRDSLGKSFFKMTPVSGQYGSGRYVGEVRTLGLITSGMVNDENGPGVLWIAVVASCDGKSTVMGTALNIRNQIDEMALMQSDDRIMWMPNVKNASFAVDDPLNVSRDVVLLYGQDKVNDWTIVEDAKGSLIIEL